MYKRTEKSMIKIYVRTLWRRLKDMQYLNRIYKYIIIFIILVEYLYI